MNSAYGKVICSINVARRACSPSGSKPGANTRITHGANRIASVVTTSMDAVSAPATRSTSALTAAWSPLALYSASTGTKAMENEPSADKRRMKFGILNAMTNASIAALAPKTCA
ncbi:hypothetical protein D3C81_1256280 [compost metagenome]